MDISNVNSINFPKTEIECMNLEQDWSRTLANRHAMPHIKGTIAAGDGLAVEIVKPTLSELCGGDVRKFWNRKGYYALIVQAFCDAHCKFIIFDVGKRA